MSIAQSTHGAATERTRRQYVVVHREIRLWHVWEIDPLSGDLINRVGCIYRSASSAHSTCRQLNAS